MSQETGKVKTMAIIASILFVSGIFGGILIAKGPLNSPKTAQSSAAYQLDLVITTNNWYNNSVGYQPAYFVVQGGKLMSSATISIPGNVPVFVTITDYDNGSAGVASPQYANVTGTSGNTVLIVNNTNVNSTASSANQGINVNGGYLASQVPASLIAHTFTVFSDGKVVLNIPVLPSSVEFATFTLPPGHYEWHCEGLCGSGPYGLEGAMTAVGWMAGTVIVN